MWKFYLHLYLYKGTVSLRKRINDFSQFQQLHKSQMLLLALSRGKTTDKEREKEEKTLLETLSRRKKKDREWLFIKEKKKNISKTWSLRKKE